MLAAKILDRSRSLFAGWFSRVRWFWWRKEAPANENAPIAIPPSELAPLHANSANRALPEPCEINEKSPIESRSRPRDEPQPNRASRRAMSAEKRHYEKQRRKFDKFVKPGGPAPAARSRPATPRAEKPGPGPATLVDNGDDFLCVDKHHSDHQTEVLYEKEEFYGQFNFRDTILDQLDRYFVYLERMRKHDRDSWSFYGHVGATLVPYIAVPELRHDRNAEIKDDHRTPEPLSAWFLRTRPMFGCLAYGTNPEAERIERESRQNLRPDKKVVWIPRFLYFTKYNRGHQPPTVEGVASWRRGDIYKMTVWWDCTEERRLKYGIPNDYFLFVGDDGAMRPLRCLETIATPNRKLGRLTDIPQRTWRLPSEYSEWAKTHKTTPTRILSNCFAMAASQVERASFHSPLRISVRDDQNRHAQFGLDPSRMPYFFRDRDYQLTESGLRKPIFHLVKEHTRKDGSVVTRHFRGAREFTWAGYRVRVTVPGSDHARLEEIAVGANDFDPDERRKREGILAPELGRRLRQIMDGTSPEKVFGDLSGAN